MKKVIEKVLSPGVFTIGYLGFLALNMISVLNIMSFTRVFLAFFAVWGAAICVRIFVFGGIKPWVQKAFPLLAGMIAVCLVTQVLNFSYGGFDVIIKLCFFALCLFILYAQYSADAKEYLSVIRKSAFVLGIVILCAMIASMAMFIFLYSGTIVGRSGATIRVGFTENRLFGVFSSPNVGGLFAIILCWVSIITIRLRGEKFRKTLLALSIVQIVFAVLYISVALSRGTYLSGAVGILACFILRSPSKSEEKLDGKKQVLVKVLSVILIIPICYAAIEVSNTVSCSVMERIVSARLNSYSEEKRVEIESDMAKVQEGFDARVEAGREDIDISNKRFRIWKDHVSLLKGKRLLLGVNQPQQYVKDQQEQGKEFVPSVVTTVNIIARGNMHNGFLQMLVNCGGVAFALLMGFIGLCVVLVIKFMINNVFKKERKCDKDSYLIFEICLPMVLTILSNNVFETNFVLMGANFFQALFWFTAGACVFVMSKKKADIQK